MANQVTTQVLVDGPRNTVIKVAAILDTSDLASMTIVDPALLVGTDNTGALKAATFRILGINFDIQDALAVNLFWDATTPVLISSLTGRGAAPPSWATYGGLTNNAALAGKTGKITMTTRGWVGTLSFNLLIELVKVQSGVVNAIAGTPSSQGYTDFAGTIPLL